MHRTLKSLLAVAVLTGSMASQAQYPDRPLTLVVPYPSGGPVDVVARVLAKGLSETLNQSVVIENRGGAGGNIGTDVVARAKPDGYTLLINTPAIVITPHVLEKVSFDPVTSFVALTQVGYVPALLLTSTKSRFDSVASLLAYGKANPGKLTFGSPGQGTSLHLAGELFSQLSGVNATHVPYKGSAPAMIDLLGGRIDFMFDSFVGAYPQVQSGNMRALAVTTAKRFPKASTIPTVEESGLSKYEFALWYGLFAPAGMPAAVIEKLGQALQQTLEKPAVRAQLEGTGLDVVGNSPAAFAREVASESKRWADLVRAVGVTNLR